MFGNNQDGPLKWEQETDTKMGTVFLLSQPETFDRIYALIKAWYGTYGIPATVKAFIYDVDSDQILSLSAPVQLPYADDPNNTYKWYMLPLLSPITLPAGRYMLGLHCGGYGGIEWKYAMVDAIDSFVSADIYDDGTSSGFVNGDPSPIVSPCPDPGPCATCPAPWNYNWGGFCVYGLWKSFSIFATFGEEPHGPTAAFTWSPQIPLIGKPVAFDSRISKDGWTGSEIAPIINWVWDFGDGTSSNDVVVTHTFENVGDYLVSLNVTDSQGLSDTIAVMVSILESEPTSITVTFEDERDFQFGVENEPRYIIYTDNQNIFEGIPKTWTYGAYSNISIRDTVGGGLWGYCKFEPENYGPNLPPPPIPDSGTRACKLECVMPTPSIHDDLRRIEVFRIHDQRILDKTLDSWIYLPPDFDPGEWCILLRMSREIIFGTVPDYPSYAMLNVVLGINEGSRLPDTTNKYWISMPLNHCTEPDRYGGTRSEVESRTNPITLGEWFYIKTYVYRHNRYGKIKVWLLTQEMIDNGQTVPQIIIDVKGTNEAPLTTMYIQPEVFDELPTYNPGGGNPYAFVGSGINLYFGDSNLVPKKAYFKNVKIATFTPQMNLIDNLWKIIPFAAVLTALYYKIFKK